MTDLQKLIIATLAYYELFDFPLTTGEIKKYLVAPKSLGIEAGFDFEAIDTNLYSLVSEGKILLDGGFYTLPKREYIIPLRIRNHKIAKKKMRRARFAASLMSALPYVQAVFASGSLALSNTDRDSDLDLFVIAKGGRIWTTRFITNTLFDLLRLKRKPKDKIAPDKLCLNHYIADDSLQIKNQNVFTAHVLLNLVPLYLINSQLIQKFEKDNNWVYLHIHQWDFSKKYLIKNNVLLGFIKKSLEYVLDSKLGSVLESATRKYQVKRIERNPLTRDPHGRIEYTDQDLEFHPQSIEQAILEKYTEMKKALN